MKLAHIVGALIAFATGYLIWRGSRSFVKAVIGGLLIPIIAFIIIGITLGGDALENASGFMLAAFVIGAIALLAFSNRRT